MAKRPPGLGAAFNLAAVVSEHPPEPAKSAAHAMPVSQITDTIFIGTGKDLKDKISLEKLRGMGITHILNVAKEVELLQQETPTTTANNNNSNSLSMSGSPGVGKNSTTTSNDETASPLPNSKSNSNNNTNDDDDMLADTDSAMTRARSVVLQVDRNLHFETEHIPLKDGVNANTMGMLDDAVTYLHKALGNGGKVMVHCRRGVSRSPAVVVAYLMKYNSMTYEEALGFVKTHRSIVELNMEFHSNLKDRSDSLLREQGLEVPRSESRCNSIHENSNTSNNGGGVQLPQK